MRNILNFIMMKYKNSSFQSKLFFSYFILIFIPLLILSFFSYNRSAQVISNQSIDIAKLYLDQTADMVESEFDKMLTISQLVAQHSYIREVLETDDISFSDEYDKMKELTEVVNSIKALYDTYRIRLYISDKFKFSNSKDVTYNINDLKDLAWYKEMIKNRQSQILLTPYTFHQPMSNDLELISMICLIRSNQDFNDIIGVVSVDMTVSQLIEYLKTADYTQDTSVCIVDGKNNILCSYGKSDVFSNDNIKDTLSQHTNTYLKESEVISDKTHIIGLSKSVFSDWRIMSMTSFDKILAQNAKLKQQLVIFAALIGIVAYCLAALYSKYNTKRIKLLAKQMKNVESGNFEVKCLVDSEDEIGDLQSSFNFMVRKINTLLNEQYNMGKNLKGMELKALQAQINPHFLYNTLDLISWKAKKSDNPEIVAIVFKLARFYQLSLSNGSDLIPLKSEFEHIRLFVDLQNIRFKKEIRLITEMDKDIEDALIMKLILQPIVENSIAHGILNMEDIQGIISVSAHKCEPYIRIIITDNGTGMEKSKLIGILSHERGNVFSSAKGGFGLLNIIDRLKVYYGSDYTFNIASSPNQGTTVTIQIPAEYRRESGDFPSI